MSTCTKNCTIQVTASISFSLHYVFDRPDELPDADSSHVTLANYKRWFFVDKEKRAESLAGQAETGRFSDSYTTWPVTRKDGLGSYDFVKEADALKTGTVPATERWRAGFKCQHLQKSLRN